MSYFQIAKIETEAEIQQEGAYALLTITFQSKINPKNQSPEVDKF
jgi:hypothetical protein